MVRTKPSQMLIAFLLLLVSTSSGMSFSGKGRIAILTGEDTSKASPADKVGCLDEYGQFTSSLSDCAVFTHHEAVAAKGFDGYLSTSVGNCTWWYSKRPANTDSKYGKNTRAFECGESVDFMENNDYTYTVNGFKYPFICNGDVNCFYDAKYIPGKKDTSFTWQYQWGADQMGITPGHVQILWLWEKV